MQLISSFFTGTDNLFKLLFLNGVLLILVGLFYPQQKKDELDLKIVEYRSNVALINREIQELFLESENLKNDIKKMQKVHLKNLSKELNKKIYEQDKKVIEVKNQQNQITVLLNQQRVYNNYCIVFIICGSIMAIIGLAGWARLTQFMYHKEHKEYKDRKNNK